MSELIPYKKHFLEILVREQRLRPKRTTDEWIEMERTVLLNAVNVERQRRGWPPVPAYTFVRVENTCLGHIDYSSKLALRCAELATAPIVEI